MIYLATAYHDGINGPIISKLHTSLTGVVAIGISPNGTFSLHLIWIPHIPHLPIQSQISRFIAGQT